MKNLNFKALALCFLSGLALLFASCETEVDKTDTTAPKSVSEVEATGGSESVLLSWKNPGDEDFYGTEITFTPEAEGVFQPVTVSGKSGEKLAYKFTGLSNGTKYTFTLTALDAHTNRSEAKTVSGTPVDTSDKTPTASVTDLEAEIGSKKVVLSWENPSDEDFYGVKISEASNSGSLKTPVFLEKPCKSFAVSELANGTEYSFSVVALDESLNESTAATVRATPLNSEDTTPPKEAKITVENGGESGRVDISWAEPSDADFYGVVISVSPAAGTLSSPVIIKKGTTSLSVFGLTNGTEYTFKVQTMDNALNTSKGVEESATPSASGTMEIELSMPPESEISNTTSTVTATITSKSKITRVVYKKNGSESPKKLLADSEAQKATETSDNSIWTFTVDERTTYTVAAIDEAGREETAQIVTLVIDQEAPAEVTGVWSEFDTATNKATITWADPEDSEEEYDSPFDHVVITYTVDDGTEIHNVLDENDSIKKFSKETQTATVQFDGTFGDTSPEVYVFNLHTVDKLGNVSAGHKIRCYTANALIINATEITSEAIAKEKISDTTVPHDMRIKVTGSLTTQNLRYISTAIKALTNSETESRLINIEMDEATINPAYKDSQLFISRFAGCKHLKSITLPKELTKIETGAFTDCTSLMSITIYDNVTTIEGSAFKNCTSLKSITLPDSVTKIGQLAFMGCTSLESVTIPKNLTSVGYGVYRECTVLKSVTIPDGIDLIGQSQFYQCSSLKNIMIPKSVKNIGDNAFTYTALTTVYYSGTESEWKSIIIGTDNTTLTNAEKIYNYTKD